MTTRELETHFVQFGMKIQGVGLKTVVGIYGENGFQVIPFLVGDPGKFVCFDHSIRIAGDNYVVGVVFQQT